MNLPLISIIIPVKAEVEALKVSLDSLRKSAYPQQKMQIVVVNDGGMKEISRFLRQHYLEVEEVHYPEVKGSYYARNRGVEIARGEWLLFMDTDMQVPPETIPRIAEKCFPHYDYIATDYRLEVKESQPFYEKYFGYHEFPFHRIFEKEKYGGTAFLLVKKAVFKFIGGFNEQLFSGGDNLFGKQVHLCGFKTFFFNDVIIWHRPKNMKQHLEAFFRRRKGMCELKKYNSTIYGKKSNFFLFKKMYACILNVKNYQNNFAYSKQGFIFIIIMELFRSYLEVVAYFKFKRS